MDPRRSTPSKLSDRVPASTLASLAVLLLSLDFLLQSTFVAIHDSPVAAISLAALLSFVLVPAWIWKWLAASGRGGPFEEDLQILHLRGPETGWIALLALAILLPLDQLGAWNEGLTPPPDTFLEWQQSLLPQGRIDLLLTYLGLGLVVPIGEEILFRGILQAALRHRLGLFSASLATGLIFGVVHFQSWALAPLVLTGVILGLVYEFTGTLVAPMLLHVTYNTTVLSLWIFAGQQSIPGAGPWLTLASAGLMVWALERLHRLTWRTKRSPGPD